MATKKTKKPTTKKIKKIVEEAKVEEQPAQETKEIVADQENTNKNEEKIETTPIEEAKVEEVVPEKIEISDNVMSKKNWIEKEQTQIVVNQDPHDGKIHVKCNANNGSFVMGQEYRVSPRVFQNYAGILEKIQ